MWFLFQHMQYLPKGVKRKHPPLGQGYMVNSELHEFCDMDSAFAFGLDLLGGITGS